MRTMKDNERFYIVAKIFLDLYGPATAKEIAKYVNGCPVKINVSPTKVGVLLRDQIWVLRTKQKGKRQFIYSVKDSYKGDFITEVKENES